MVEDDGFRAFVKKLDPAYVLPTRLGLKDMVAKVHSDKREGGGKGEKANNVNLKSYMWIS